MYTFLPLSQTKPIYSVKDHPEFFAKHMSNEERVLQELAAKLGIAPQIHGSVGDIVLMDRIEGMSLADFYGEDAAAIPAFVWEQIRAILQTLWNHGIAYVDITPYNFLLDTKERVWIIDFGHARRVSMPPFLQSVLDGACLWNPDFA